MVLQAEVIRSNAPVGCVGLEGRGCWVGFPQHRVRLLSCELWLVGLFSFMLCVRMEHVFA